MNAAVVNEDRPAVAHLISGETETLEVGSLLVDTLTDPAPDQEVGFTWQEMPRDAADQALDRGEVAAVLYIPRTLSVDVIENGEANTPPRQCPLSLTWSPTTG